MYSTRTIFSYVLKSILLITIGIVLVTSIVYATAPSAGGDTTVVNPTGEGAVSINEDAPEPEQANIRLIVSTLTDSGGGTPNSIRILSVTGGTLQQGGGGSITLGAAGTILSLSSSRLDLRFKPASNRSTNASFQYVVVDPHDNAVNSPASTATVSITSVNDTPLLQTLVGTTGTGLAATYYLTEWDLTGSTYNRVDSTVNFSNNFGVPGLNTEQFSVRWTGKIESPVTGNVTFSTQSDDGVRLWVNGTQIIDNWTLHGTTTDTANPVALEAGTKYDIQMEFYERGGGEVAILQWAYTGQSTQVIPQARLFPATVRPVLKFITGSSAVVIDDAITVSDVDTTTITGATAEISNNYQSGQDFLQFTNQNGITGSFSTGTLTLSGTATLAQYQTALRSIKYFNNSATPNTSTRTVRFRANDGTDNSNYVYRDIEFSATNSAPVITEGASTTVTMDEDGAPTAFSLTLNATDADQHSISWSVSSQASHGTASVGDPGNSTAITYTPTANYFGSDSFVIQASDGLGGTDTITVNVTITSDGNSEITPTQVPTATPTPGTSSSSVCSSQAPSGAPDLFQVSTSPSTATVYFSPVSPASSYTVSYGKNTDASEKNVSFDYSDKGGAVPYTINGLDEGVTYYFKVQAKNGCKTGDWSKILTNETTTSETLAIVGDSSITPTPIPRGTLNVVSKKTTTKPQPTSTPVVTPSDSPSGDGVDLEITVLKAGNPVAGATVEVHSTPRRAITDKDGIARFTNIEKGDHTVHLAYEGYNGREKITVDGTKKNVDIELTIEFNPYNNMFFVGGILCFVVLLLTVFYLLFLLKKRKKSEKKHTS